MTIIGMMLLSLCCSSALGADALKATPPLTYYGGYFNVTRHWQNRVTTEFTNLTRINGDYESHLTQNGWMCRTRNQRIQYDIQYRFNLKLSDEEMLARLRENREWLESRNMLELIDMLYLADEPYRCGHEPHLSPDRAGFPGTESTGDAQHVRHSRSYPAGDGGFRGGIQL